MKKIIYLTILISILFSNGSPKEVIQNEPYKVYGLIGEGSSINKEERMNIE